MAEQRSHTEAAERQVKSGFPGKLLFAGLLLLPALRRQTALVALMLFGFGWMLMVAGSEDKQTAAIVSGWGYAFLLLSGLLLLLFVASTVIGKFLGVIAPHVRKAWADQQTECNPIASNPKSDEVSEPVSDTDLSKTERALIKLLRSNDVPPDIVAESIREVLERRMGR
jgi:hypothetical protein